MPTQRHQQMILRVEIFHPKTAFFESGGLLLFLEMMDLTTFPVSSDSKKSKD